MFMRFFNFSKCPDQTWNYLQNIYNQWGYRRVDAKSVLACTEVDFSQ